MINRNQLATPYTWETGNETSNETEQLTLNLINYPANVVFHTNRLSRELPTQKDITEISYQVSNHGNSGQITGSITFEDLKEQLPTIDHTDMLIYVGVSRLYEAGYTGFTPQLVWRYATSNKQARVTKKQRELVAERLDKMMTMVITVDVTAEYVDTYKKTDAPTVELSENLLYLRKTKVTLQGRKQEGYALLAHPILDRYSRDLNQITYYERDLIESAGGVEDALLTKYIAERIAGMKNDKNNIASNRILLTRIYTAMDVKEPNKYKRSQIKDKLEQLLKTWKNKEEIKGYKFIKKGRAWYGVDIIF